MTIKFTNIWQKKYFFHAFFDKKRALKRVFRLVTEKKKQIQKLYYNFDCVNILQKPQKQNPNI
ncbi:hypothetical protein BOW55_20180 [Flavobacterium sp. YO12]|nr:hypothetical protein BOW55_20180 [Flavobacterium sp. YO12]